MPHASAALFNAFERRAACHDITAGYEIVTGKVMSRSVSITVEELDFGPS
jgi:hypothetical protein